jgi:hypothetical protein
LSGLVTRDEEDVMFNYSAIMAMALAAIAAISTIPFSAGLLGFSRRISYVLTAMLISVLIYLEAVTFSGKLKYQDAYQIALTDFWSLTLCTVALLIPFVYAHWLGTQMRAAVFWIRNRFV